MKASRKQQILVGGVGGQGVLFVTSLLAQAAIRNDLAVLTSETHGMAQRGGAVVSHLKVGRFSSPMIRPGQADILLALKAESVAPHEPFLGPHAWIAVNRSGNTGPPRRRRILSVDANRLAEKIGNPKAANLVLLGFALAQGSGSRTDTQALFCSLEDLKSVLKARLKGRQRMLEACIRALEEGHRAG